MDTREATSTAPNGSDPEDMPTPEDASGPDLLTESPTSSRGTGEGVDRRIESSTFTQKRIAVAGAVLLGILALGYDVWTTATGGSALTVDRGKVTVSTVEQGNFQEFIAVTGTAVPEKTFYLDAVEGGRVEEVHVQEGATVTAGEPILRLSNNDLRRQVLDSKASIAEQQSRMEQLRVEMRQNRLDLQQQLAQMKHEIRQLKREFERQKRLHAQDLIAGEEFQSTRSELQYQRRRLRLTQEAYRQDSLARASRLDEMRQTRQRLDRSYETMQGAIESLTIRAPTNGQLTSLDAEPGQMISAGTRVGQVDGTDSYLLRAQVDEFYLDRVQHGQTATTDALGDTTYVLTVDRVHPEVEDGWFEVDLAFKGEVPSGLRRGQNLRLRLKLGQPQEATLLARGGFYQSTGGNWAYVLTGEGEAVRRPIRLGRQNPNYFEVLKGLNPGDRVITSSYDTFGDADRLVLE